MLRRHDDLLCLSVLNFDSILLHIPIAQVGRRSAAISLFKMRWCSEMSMMVHRVSMMMLLLLMMVMVRVDSGS